MYKEQLSELERLKKENQYLKKLLSYIMQDGNHHAFAVPLDKIITGRSSPEDKIALFKHLFKGRSDTYAVRWEAKNGKSGYAPACQLEWQKPICRKPDILCSECGNRQLLPLTDQVLYDHLSGKKTIGLYPLQKDDTCSLLVLDFDKKDFREDVAAFVQVCSNFQVPVNIERSRSGNGAHVWIFLLKTFPQHSQENSDMLF